MRLLPVKFVLSAKKEDFTAKKRKLGYMTIFCNILRIWRDIWAPIRGEEKFMADKASAFAAFLIEESTRLFGESMDDDMLHDFLYLIQREALIMEDQPAFEDNLVGGQSGPKCPAVWAQKLDSAGLSAEGRGMALRVLEKYGRIAANTIHDITTNQISWLEARHMIKEEKNGAKPLRLETMRLDASREKLKRRTGYR